MDSEIKYPYQLCAMFKTPVRTQSDYVAYENGSDEN